MSKKEYIESLREYLSYELPERLVTSNIRRYEEYFDDQLKSGRSATEISEELGDPKLIARSCIDAAKSGKDGIPNSDDDPDFAEEIDRENAPNAANADASGNGQAGDSQQGNTRIYTSKGCLIPLLILIVIIAVIVLIFVTGAWLYIVIGVLIISAVVGLIRLIRGK